MYLSETRMSVVTVFVVFFVRLHIRRMRRSGFSDQRIAEMEAMLMNSMKRPAQRAFTASEQSR